MSDSVSVRRAKQVVEAVSGRILEEWDTDGRQGAVDLRDAKDPTLSVEVKRWTCQTYRKAIHAWEKAKGWHPDASLGSRWSLLVEVPTTGSRVDALPRFGSLVDDMTGLIRSMIELGLAGDSDLSAMRLLPDVHPLWLRFRELLPGGGSLRSSPVFSAAETPDAYKQPGLEVALSHGRSVSADPNRFATEVEEWLHGSSAQAVNLRSKLENANDVENHAYLELDPSHDSWWMLHHWGTQHLPTVDIQLPAMVNRVWVGGYGSVVWWFDSASGWSGIEVEH